jgi:hypothetical protein
MESANVNADVVQLHCACGQYRSQGSVTLKLNEGKGRCSNRGSHCVYAGEGFYACIENTWVKADSKQVPRDRKWYCGTCRNFQQTNILVGSNFLIILIQESHVNLY